MVSIIFEKEHHHRLVWTCSAHCVFSCCAALFNGQEKPTIFYVGIFETLMADI